MNERIPLSTSYDAYKALAALEQYLARSGLSRELVGLVKLRVSQINGCAFCIDLHWQEQRRHDAGEARLYGLLSWREQSVFSPRERAALAWAEAVTNVDDGHVADSVYAEVKAHFSEKEVADLTYAIVAANSWNRLCIAFRVPPGAALPRGEGT